MTTEADVVQATKQLLADFPPETTKPGDFWGAQYDAGLAWVHFPVGRGGLAASPKLQEKIDMALREAAAPINMGYNPIGVGMAAPTVLTHGSDELIDATLRKNFTCEEVWCQLFSEPGAGSDLAGLSTKAVRDGDEWILNGQKVWTTLAHMATWGLVVARTDSEAPKHKGLTYFVMDMHAEGVEVRPLRQITGEAEFNEVYMTDARVPDLHRLGEVGNGWAVSMTTLMNERVSIGGSIAQRGSGPIGDAVKLWKQYGHDDPAVRDELMRLWCDAETARLTNIRAQMARVGGNPGPEGSTGKLAYAENNKAIYAFSMNLRGADGMLIGGDGYKLTRPTHAGFAGEGETTKAFLRSRANSIEGGTSEIMRNILGERILGLPGEPRVDKDLPWSKVPRS
ncbi:MAG: acyl-CoA dehydrogenase family protein [Actinobacteria bacterium]|nr:acyl-CoA dehydrogenase family protein [Actinomycetota bacterium]